MLAIGEGSKQEALEQIRRLGASNVIVRSVKPQPTSGGAISGYVLAYGLTFADLRRIEDLGMDGAVVVPSVMHTKNVQHGKRHLSAVRVFGTTPEMPSVKDVHIDGRFISPEDIAESANVVVMGRGIANEIFGFENPIGNSLLVGEDAFRVIGVASYQSGHGRANAPITDDRNHELYVPLSAAKNRMGIVQRIVETGSRQYVRFELSEVIIKFKDQSQVRSASAVIRSLLTKSHPDKVDYDVQVPLELLNQAESEKRLWNLVLGSIAGISLLVGGSGL